MPHALNPDFFRIIPKKEVDFLVTIEEKPWFSVETKMSDTGLSPHLHYFREKLKTPYSYQVAKKSGIDRLINGIRVLSGDKFQFFSTSMIWIEVSIENTSQNGYNFNLDIKPKYFLTGLTPVK